PANPYAPPRADLGPGPAAAAGVEELPVAGLGARFFNCILDGIISRVLVTYAAVSWLKQFPLEPGAAVALRLAISLGSFAAYYIFLEGAFGWTFGKLITGTRVVRWTGEKPTLLQIIGRTFARFIPFEAFSFLFANAG